MATKSIKSALKRGYPQANLGKGMRHALTQGVGAALYKTRPGALPYLKSVKTLLRSVDWPSSYNFINDHPKNKNTGWVYDDWVQGIACNGRHWFITQMNRLWRIPVSYDLSKKINKSKLPPGVSYVGIPPSLKDYNHFGDLDYYNGYLYIALEDNKDWSVPSRVAVFDASNLAYVTSSTLPGQPKNCPWCAINPLNGNLYSSAFRMQGGAKVHIYGRDFNASKKKLTLKKVGDMDLLRENGTPLKIIGVQGGAFSQNGHLYLIVWDFDLNDDYDDGLMGFDMITGRRKAHVKVKYQLSEIEELEGMCIYDLDNAGAPNIRGQFHVLLLDHEAVFPGDDDEVYLKHYGVPAEDKGKI